MGFLSRFAPVQRVRAALRSAAASSNPSETTPIFAGISSHAIVEQIEANCIVSTISSRNSNNINNINDLNNCTENTGHLPFRLSVSPSLIHGAGLGVFVSPNAKNSYNTNKTIARGTVVALYPGLVYAPSDPVFFPSINNHYVLQRQDGSFIDAKHKGLSSLMFRSAWKREKAWNGITYDASWPNLRKQRLPHEPRHYSPSWNLGQLINNSFDSLDSANVIYNEFTLTTSFPNEWRRFIPNVPYSPETVDIDGIALVTTKDLIFDSDDDCIELLASYQSVC